ncbi:putative mitochondrial protein, partial [Mucuna pruriens]
MKTYHPIQQILGNVEDRIKTRSTFNDQAQMTMLSEVEPKNIEETLLDVGWILAMQEKNDIWKLVSPPNDKSIIGTKLIFKNKLDENGKIIHNKVRLVAQDYSQQEEIKFTEILSLVARLEAIHIFLSFAAHYNMRLHQIDVIFTFMNGIINEEALCWLKKAPHVWHEKLSSFLMTNGFQRGKVDTTLIHKNYD